MVNRIGTVNPAGQIKGSVRDSVWTPEFDIKHLKERRCHDSRKIIKLINSDPAVLDALVTCDESLIFCYDTETKRQSPQWKCWLFPDPRRPDRANPPTNIWWALFSDSTGKIYMHWVPTGQTVNRGSRGDSVRRGQQSSNRVSGISTRTLHQSTTLSLSKTIWPR